jgi:hypothetical protein
MHSPSPTSRFSLSPKGMIFTLFVLLTIGPIIFMTIFVDFDRWMAQWQVWWGLQQAEETAVTQANVIDFYEEKNDAFVTYRYSAPNQQGEQQGFEKTEQVNTRIFDQIKAGETVMVDFDLNNPDTAGLASNHNPFGRLIVFLALGFGALKSKVRNHRSPLPNLVKNISALDQAKQTGTTPSASTKQSSSRNWTRLELILIILLVLIVQFILLSLFLTR